MMNKKNIYYEALKENKGSLNEIDLGAHLGLDENETRAIIALLLAEYKIDYEVTKACNYSLMKTKKRTIKKR